MIIDFIYIQFMVEFGANGVSEYRICSDKYDVEREAEKIIKSKTKKGYQEIKLVSASVGSDLGKAKVENNSVSLDTLAKLGVKIEEDTESKLHKEVQDLVRTWFGATQQFVDLNLDTNKCALGQLSLDQINKAKDILNEARTIVHKKKPDTSELNKLTSSYYSNIPHVLPHRISADILRFDSDERIDKAFDILDVFSSAKDVQGIIAKKNAIDSQYNTLNAKLDYVDPSDPVWKWVDAMLHGTKASNHGFLGNLKTHKVFKVARTNEDKYFYENAERIAKECGTFNPSKTYAKLVKERPDVPKELRSLYEKANIAPGWHGTRRANMVGITSKGLLIRPSGVVHAR